MAKNSSIVTTIDGELINSEEFKTKVRKWANTVRVAAKSNISKFQKGKRKTSHTYKSGWHKGKTEYKLQDKLSYVIKEKNLVPDHIGYKFPLHGIFREWGVGNGQPRSENSTKTYIKRSMSDWLDEPIDNNTGRLADVASEFYGDNVLVNTYGAKIKKK